MFSRPFSSRRITCPLRHSAPSERRFATGPDTVAVLHLSQTTQYIMESVLVHATLHLSSEPAFLSPGS